MGYIITNEEVCQAISKDYQELWLRLIDEVRTYFTSTLY